MPTRNSVIEEALPSRNSVIEEACEKCMRTLYAYAQPKVDFDDFIKENKEYIENGEKGPRPFEFYYLPQNVFKDIVDSYIHAYRIAPELKSNIETIKGYLENPIRDKFIKKEGAPGYRGYENFAPLSEVIGSENYDKVKEYLDEAGKFFQWNRMLQKFNMSVYLGASPNSNKDSVIENWKKYRNADITIDDSIYEDDEENS